MQNSMPLVAVMAVALGMCVGCAGASSTDRGAADAPAAKPLPVLVADPVAAVKAALPEGWHVDRVEEGARPLYRAEGKGTAIYLVEAGRKYIKQQFSAVLFVMPADYRDDLEPGTFGPAGAQTNAPALIVAASNAKVYLWGGENLKAGLLKALIQEAGHETEISWEKAKSLFASGRITSVSQNHKLVSERGCSTMVSSRCG
jgi:hypothetical protein